MGEDERQAAEEAAPAAEEEAFEPPPPPPGAAPPQDANALRGYHFKLLLASPATWTIVGVLVVGAGVAAAIVAKNGGLGAGAAVAVLLVSILAVFAIADGRAADSFFAAYAEARGMTLLAEHSRMPATTPLLKKGDDRYAERLLEGPLAEGTEGRLATYTYEETSYGKDGKETNYYRYTLGYVEVPESVPLVPELYVQRKSGLRSLEKFEDVFRGSKQRVKFESEALDRKYEIFVSEMQDPIKVHRLFSPTFLVWLVEQAPDKFAFELVGGKLCCYVNGHKENAEALDRIASATASIAKRLRDEALE
jgi:hypothetical protein